MPSRSVLPPVLALLLGGGCAAHPEPTARSANATATAAATAEATSPLALADALEQQIEDGRDTPEARRAAHERASELVVRTAEDALGRAILAGRRAQVGGLAALGLVREIERYARLSAELDPTLR
ncbi:MAG TPA: hypothetical protein VFU02_06725, partial [Polyangiaceae bacterium]|nr:hypothetical protein [Polyangiaceae bacterium]